MICPHCSFDNLPGVEECEGCRQDLTQLDQPAAQDRIQKSLMEDPVSVLKPHTPVTLAPTATVRDALQMMLYRNIGALLVMDAQGKMLGIFSERDVLLRVADKTAMPLQSPVSDFMTPNPETVGSDATLAFVLHKMDSGGYRHLPVMENGKPIGMISVRDMLSHFTRLCGTCQP